MADFEAPDREAPEFWVEFRTLDHSALNNRDAADQHPIGAVTGLQDALDTTSGNVSELQTKVGDLSSLETEHKDNVVSAVNEVKETTDNLQNKVSDVRVANVSVVDSTKTANIPLGSLSTVGVVKIASWSGLSIQNQTGVIFTNPATVEEIADKTDANKPITPLMIDDAVKAGVVDNYYTLTDAEKQSACAWLGAINLKPDGTNNFFDNYKITIRYLPDVVLGQVVYAGNVDPSTAVATLTTNGKTKLGTTSDTITLTNDTTAVTGYEANEGCFYICTANGTFAGLDLLTGDWLVSIGTAWKKVDNTDAVTGVKGSAESTYRTGNVEITADNVLPMQTGNSGKYLTTNGSTASWTTVDALPAQSGNNGKYLTTNGSVASWATVDTLPTQTSNQGKFLTTDGTDASWSNLPVSDVQVNGTTVTTSGIANIPIASNSTLGVVKVFSAYGLALVNGTIAIQKATDEVISQKINAYQVIVPSNLDVAIREGLGNNSLTWTEAYKTSARNTIGATRVSFVDWTD